MTEKIAESCIQTIKDYLLRLQDNICSSLEQEESDGSFFEDTWLHQQGDGGGQTRVLNEGTIFEQAGVNFSHVSGLQLPTAATLKRPNLMGSPFQALGVSVVIHPRNPFIPTAHLNVRFFIATPTDQPAIWWFGGGYDLTPYYGFTEDCQHWHRTAKAACDPFGPQLYPRFKQWCDEYFYIKHRGEPRGIGGLFFDDLNEWDFAQCFAFVKSVGDSFMAAYQPIVARRKEHPYGEQERIFQAYRRGRYVEFNLVYDRGTLFGLQSGGRTDSILVSLPPQVRFGYRWQPPAGSREAQLYDYFLVPRDWAAESI